MTKYRTKQADVEAMRIEAGNDADVMRWCGGAPTDSLIEGKLYHVPVGPRPITSTRMPPPATVARVGDWIVKTTDGFVVLTDAEFRARYEEVKPAVEVKPAAAPVAKPATVAKAAEAAKAETAKPAEMKA